MVAKTGFVACFEFPTGIIRRVENFQRAAKTVKRASRIRPGGMALKLYEIRQFDPDYLNCTDGLLS
jgi:hypothetical protein